MSLYRRKDSPYWWVKLPTIRGESGPLQTSSGTASKRKAQEFHDTLKAQRWEQDKLGAKPRRTWQEAAVKFLEETTHKRSQSKDLGILRWLDPVLGGKCLDEVDRQLIDRIKAAKLKESTASTVNRYLALIRTILRKAHYEWEWLDRIPKVTLYREPDGRTRSLTFSEFERLHAELPAHLADMALFTVATGLRQANVAKLEWVEVSLERRHAWIPASKFKNGKPHAVPLNDVALSVLVAQMGKHPTYVFTFRGKPVTNVSTKAWWAALDRAGIDNFRWHDLRHTFATWHRQAGTPTHELQRLGGWKTLSMVERYAHIAPEGLQQAAGRLDNVLRGYALATPEKKGGLTMTASPSHTLVGRVGLEPTTKGFRFPRRHLAFRIPQGPQIRCGQQLSDRRIQHWTTTIGIATHRNIHPSTTAWHIAQTTCEPVQIQNDILPLVGQIFRKCALLRSGEF